MIRELAGLSLCTLSEKFQYPTLRMHIECMERWKCSIPFHG